MISYHNHTEKELTIPLRDGKKLHAILRGELKPDMPVVVMMHGRTGSANELLQYLGARYISERNITTLRLSMYDFGADYRSILDCTLETHIADFEDVIHYLRAQDVTALFALGHSYGGLTILGSKAKLEGAVLWDPSHGLAMHNNPEFQNPIYPTKVYDDILVGTGGHGFVYPLSQAEHDETLGDTTDWVEDKDYPVKFILAAAGPLAKYAKSYYLAAGEPKEIVEIQDAHHQFVDNDEVMETLFAETVEWIARFNRK